MENEFEKNINGKVYYPTHGSIAISLAQIAFGTSINLDDKKKQKIRIVGYGVVYCQGLVVIENGYKNNIVNIEISDFDYDDIFTQMTSQLQEAKLKGWNSFAGISYNEEHELDTDEVSYSYKDEEAHEFESKIYMHIFLSMDIINEIIKNIENPKINSINIDFNFINFLSDEYYVEPPDRLRYIPPKVKKNNTIQYNCIGSVENLSFSYRTSYLKYNKIENYCIETAISKKSREHLLNNFYKEFYKITDHLEKLNTPQLDYYSNVGRNLKEIKYYLIAIIIIGILHLIFK